MAEIFVIPGIGGHPEFHEYLIKRLENLAPVISNEHGDFRCAPFHTLREHGDYWESILNSHGGSKKILVAISFGCHIALDLIARRRSDIISVILISFFPVTKLFFSILSVTNFFPRSVMARIVGVSLFFWSTSFSDNPIKLKEQRIKLYDSNVNVYGRIYSRLRCMQYGSPDVEIFAKSLDIALIYGESELIYCISQNSIKTLSGNAKILTVPGSHSISIKRNDCFLDTLEKVTKRLLEDE